jgi:hypothetical protein
MGRYRVAASFADFTKKLAYSSTLHGFVRKRWKYEHNLAFLLDSQAKFP